jgi:DNA-binding transcriptional regulator LsrR (DeoR family)
LVEFFMSYRLRVLPLLALAVTIGACAKKETPPNADSAAAANAPPPVAPAPVMVKNIDLGKSLSDYKGIKDHSETFSQRDTMFVSVQTDGVGAGVVAVRWSTEAGKLIDSTSQSITANGESRTVFFAAQKKPWATGKYQLDVTLNGVSAGSKKFEIKRP